MWHKYLTLFLNVDNNNNMFYMYVRFNFENEIKVLKQKGERIKICAEQAEEHK